MLADSDGTTISANGSSSRPTSNIGSRRATVSVTNGTYKAGSAAATAQNGKEVVRPRPSSYLGHDVEEVTRIMIQALADLGYHEAAESVSRVSGFDLESQTVADFRSAVLAGSWAEAERLLFGTGAPSNGPHSSASNGLVLAPGAERNVMRFWLRQQKFLELLEHRDTGRALYVLRNELTPLYQDTQKLHFLSSLLMCQSAEDLRVRADWDGAAGHSRHILLSDLSHCISPSVMLPEHRLATLLQQVKDSQVLNCLYHTSAASPSLYSDHFCDKHVFPTQVVRELDKDSSEVWQIKFSHDGSLLASSGKTTAVMLWDTATFELRHQLEGHGEGVGNFAFSPDDKMILTCGRDRYARIWETATGTLIRTFEKFAEPVSCAEWTADGQSILIGSFDKEKSLCQWSLDGQRLYTWTKRHRTEDLAVSADGQWLVTKSDQSQLYIYNFVTRELDYEMTLQRRPSSISISQDSRLLLINFSTDGEVHLFDIATRGAPIQKYLGCTGGAYLIRSRFGGANESFVMSGSDDGKLAVWHKATGVQIFLLEAHTRCNAVAWSPSDPCMFASCGDDGKIKIWANRGHKASLLPTSQSSRHNGYHLGQFA